MAAYGGKRLFDLLLTGLAAPLWIPALLVTAVLVRIRMGSPVLFQQQRAGRDALPFACTKFRTMTDARDASGALLPDEARLTRFGRWLRSTSLDELPELLNVVRGEMGLVGPRPLPERYVSRYTPWHRRRLEVRPGITGLAQVSGRNAISWDEKLDLDVSYVDRCNLRMDLAILWRTVAVVGRREGIETADDSIMPEFLGSSAASSEQ